MSYYSSMTPEQKKAAYDKLNEKYWYQRSKVSVSELFDWLALEGNRDKFLGYNKKLDKIQIYASNKKPTRDLINNGVIKVLTIDDKLFVSVFLNSKKLYISIGCCKEDKYNANKFIRFRSTPEKYRV